MFTGIVEELGKIKNIVHGRSSIKLNISCKKVLTDSKIGDSISVNGICLTVTQMGSDWFTADVMPETLRKTSLRDLDNSSSVNLERALRLSDRLGGHLVSGHIDGIGTITEKIEEDNALWYSIEADRDILKYVVMKGSVAIDGTSLTVAYIDESKFKVSLIPHTTSITTLGLKRAGDIVNIECDLIAKYIEKLFSGNNVDKKPEDKKSLSIEFLMENGFA
ncbi:MAG: riboflavin synthase [Bacillota bacterium]|nr:riboflavin synthase [Bacillota bacterium]